MVISTGVKMNTEDVQSRMIANRKRRSPGQQAETNTMQDSFQDGGQRMNVEQTEFQQNMEGSFVNSGMNNFVPTPGDQGIGTEGFGRESDGVHPSQMPHYNTYNRGSYTMADNPNMAGNEFASHNAGYHGQFPQSGGRPGYQGGVRPGMAPVRPGMGTPGMGMMGAGFSQGQQRMMSGQSISQQTGPTPTLNQLLQTPNSSQRYPQNNYGDYSGVPPKGSGDVGGTNPPYGMPQGWSPSQRGMAAYPQMPMSMSSPYRNQMPSHFSQQQNQMGYNQGMPHSTQGQQFMNQQQPMPMQQQPQPPGQPPGSSPVPHQPTSQPSPHQRPTPQPSPHQQRTTSQPSPHQQRSTPQPSPVQRPTPQTSPSPLQRSTPQPSPSQRSVSPSVTGGRGLSPSPQNQQVKTPQQNHQSSPQDPAAWNSNSKKISEEADSAMEVTSSNQDENSNSSVDNSGSQNNSQSQSSTPGIRPVPSPGSVGSRSNTPASLTGNQAGSPMPPRPPSQQLDGQQVNARMSQSSPMPTQGSGYPQRQPGSQGMGGYPQQNMYNGPNQMPGNPMYNNMPMNRASYMYGGQGAMMGMNNQYGNYGNHMPPGQQSSAPGQNMGGPGGPGPMNTMGPQVPDSNGIGRSPATGMRGQVQSSAPGAVKGAQAAAQAALIAAANSASGRAGQPVRPTMTPQPRMFAPQSMSPLSQMGQMNNHMGYNSTMNNIPPSSSQQQPQHNSISPVPMSMGQSHMSTPGGKNSKMSGTSVSTSLPASIGAGDPMSKMMGMAANSKPTKSSNTVLPPTGMLPNMPGMQEKDSSSAVSPHPSVSTPNVPESNSLPQSQNASEQSSTIPPESSETPPSDSQVSSLSSQHSDSNSSAPSMGPVSTNDSAAMAAAAAGSNDVSTSFTDKPSPAPGDQSISATMTSEEQPITTTANSSTCETTTTVTQSIMSPVTSVSMEMGNSNDSQTDHIPPPMVNCVPMPPVPIMEEPPEKKKKKGGADVMKLYEMGMEPDRRPFLDRLFAFLEDKGTPITTMPCISKQPLDLFRLYMIVREKGGMVEVTKAKKWKEICGMVNIGSSASAAFTLKKNYIKYMFSFECQYDRGGIDPAPILAQMEQQLQIKREQKQKHRAPSPGRAPSPAGSQGSQDAFRTSSTPNSNTQPGMENYPPGMPQNQYMQNDPNMGHMGPGGMMPNHMMNNMGPQGPMMGPQGPHSMGGNSGMPHMGMSGGPGGMQGNMMATNMPQGGMMGSGGYMMPGSGGPNMMGPNSMGPQGGMMGGNTMAGPNNMMGNMSGNMAHPNAMMGSGMNQPNMMAGNMPQQNSMMGTMNQPSSMMGNSMNQPNSMMGNSMNQQSVMLGGGMNQPNNMMAGMSQMMNPQSNMMGSGMTAPNSMMGTPAANPPNSMMGNSVNPPSSMMGTSANAPNSMMGSSGNPPNSMMVNTVTPVSNMPPTSMIGNSVTLPNSVTGSSVTPPTSMMGNSSNTPNSMMGTSVSQPNSNMGMISQSNASSGNSISGPVQSSSPMIPNTGAKMNSDSVSCQDPFADEPSNTNFNRQSMGPQMPPFTAMPPQTSLPVSTFNSTSSMSASTTVSSFSSSSSPVVTNSLPDSTSGMPPQDNRNRMPVLSESIQTSTPPAIPVPSRSQPSEVVGPNQFGGSNTTTMTSGRQFPFGDQFSKPDRFDQPSPVAMPNQSQPYSQPSSQPSHVGMMGQPPSGEQNYPGRYGNQVQTPASMPQEQYGSQNYPNQSGGYPQRPMMNQEQYQGYPNQQAPYSKGMPQMNREMSGSIYNTPNKRFPESDRREGYMTPDSRREQGQWGSPVQQHRYPPQHGTPGYSSSGMSPGPNMMHMPPYMSRNSRMSPMRPDKSGTMSPNKMQPQKTHSMMGHTAFPQKKEMIFPVDSVESAQPLLNKRRRLTKHDIGQVEAWRLMMSLKSGLLAESTWALDTLSILLFDDNSIQYFGLNHMPGLLEVLLDHFRRSLMDMFNLFDEMEISSRDFVNTLEKMTIEESLLCEKDQTERTKGVIAVYEGKENFTFVTRKGKEVKIEEESEHDGLLDDHSWDKFSDFDTKADLWAVGIGDITSHIKTHFTNLDEYKNYRKRFFRKPMTLKEEFENQNEDDKENEEPASEKMEVDTNCDENSDNKEQKLDSIDSKADRADSEEKSELAESEKLSHHSEGADSFKSDPSNDRSDVGSEKSDSMMENKCSLEKEHTCNSFIAKVHIKSEPRDPELDKTDSIDSCSDIKVKEENCSCDEKPGLKLPVKFELLDNVELVRTCKNSFGINSEGERNNMEDEAYHRDEPPLCLNSEGRNEIAKRCICISNIFRSLSCVPTNHSELSKHAGLIYILGKLLLLHHNHLPRSRTRRKFDREEAEEDMDTSSSEEQWWWEYLDALRENTFVIFANIAGHLNLNQYSDRVNIPVLEGLLHWMVCPSACATDPLPTLSPNSVLSPLRLVLEALCKLCIHDRNVDLLLAMPPFERIVQLFGVLTKLLANKSEQVTVEFSIVLLSELVQGGESAARGIALQHPTISLLIDFLETAEQKAVQVANVHGINMLRDSPEMMGTSLDMLRRAATTLLHLAQVEENRVLFVHHQSRLLSLVMSQILDQHVAQILSDVLFQCSQES